MAYTSLLGAFLTVFGATGSASGATCESLAALAFPDATVTAAQLVPAGSGPAKDLPEYCRVSATLRPSSDSDIRVEVWLPATGWNNKYLAVGNGGWNGSIDAGALANGLRRGYAVSATDTGHQGGGGPWMGSAAEEEHARVWAEQQASIAAVEAERSRLAGECTRLAAEWKTLTARLDVLQRGFDKEASARANAEVERDANWRESQRLAGLWEGLRAEHTSLETERTRLAESLVQHGDAARRLQVEIASQARELTSTAADRDRLTRELAVTRARLTDLESALRALRNQLTTHRAGLRYRTLRAVRLVGEAPRGEEPGAGGPAPA